jgi:hypothetical protein
MPEHVEASTQLCEKEKPATLSGLCAKACVCTQRRRRRSKKGRVNVVAPQVQQAYGGQPPTLEGQLEGYYLTFLAIAFVVILLEGLFLALSVQLSSSSSCRMPASRCTLSYWASSKAEAACRASSQRVRTNSRKMLCTQHSLHLSASSWRSQLPMESGRCGRPTAACAWQRLA